METIEERAEKYASKKGDISLSDIYNKALANIYKEVTLQVQLNRKPLMMKQTTRKVITMLVKSLANG